MAFDSPSDIVSFIRDRGIRWVDVRFTDVPGVMQHLSIPAHQFDEEAMIDGLAFDGSSISGYTSVDNSDMNLVPDLSTAYVDPFRESPTLNMMFFVQDPHTTEPFSRDPRNIALKAEKYLAATGIADTCFLGSEAEFYIFDKVRYDTTSNRSFHEVDSVEGWWNSGKEHNPDGSRNLGHKVRTKGGYFPVAPYDHLEHLRDEIGETLDSIGFTVERAHHEMGSGGQQEVNYRFNTLLHAADDLQTFKYIVKNVAKRNGRSATFMPKPLAGDGGSGMHAHMSLWKDGEPLFHDEAGYGGLSDLARFYIGGILEHAGAVLAFTNPTLNSYHRLVPGFEAPINLVYSQQNRSAAIRIPLTGPNPKAKRIEFRAPDASGNPYLAFTAMLMAGLDGIRNRIEPPAPVDKDLYELPPEEAKGIPTVPTSLEAALHALEEDHEFLVAGDVFTEDLIEAHIRHKFDEEIVPARLRPTTQEFELYYDC
ncbi:type I glutamate--ammonia ligase [Corynebacterium sphenisci]|uniref:type I glutamate--ammonia ligase n=1 Tax=Corynebacterium sphenisci TaxID=191493 RepID=UPI0026DF7366|nr:type I glutamate--ammonia ligase [Corynebacterium sphenisci]MDO5731759.1 type I glutamate--ammonia ligase [Corynebacterium sphenisci]